jgi:hypothetical protein
MADTAAGLNVVINDGSGPATQTITANMLRIQQEASKTSAAMKALSGSTSFNNTSMSGLSSVKQALNDLRSPLASTGSQFDNLRDRILRIGATVLVFRALGDAVGGFISFIKSGITAVDEFQISVIQIAAGLTQIAIIRDRIDSNDSGKMQAAYSESARYADVLARKLMEIDKNSLANYAGLMAMLQVMTAQGVVLDVNNKKQVESFTAISNAIALYTAGQDQNKQMFQEMRALMSGTINQGSTLAKVLNEQIKAQGLYKGGLKDVVALGKQHGDLLERLAPYLAGINMASGDINKTWTAIKTSLETSINLVQRKSFTPVVAELSGIVSNLNEYLRGNADVLANAVHGAWIKVRNAVFDVDSATQKLSIKPEVAKMIDSISAGLKNIGSVILDGTAGMVKHSEALINMVLLLTMWYTSVKLSSAAHSIFNGSISGASKAIVVEAEALAILGKTQADVLTKSQLLAMAEAEKAAMYGAGVVTTREQITANVEKAASTLRVAEADMLAIESSNAFRLAEQERVNGLMAGARANVMMAMEEKELAASRLAGATAEYERNYAMNASRQFNAESIAIERIAIVELEQAKLSLAAAEANFASKYAYQIELSQAETASLNLQTEAVRRLNAAKLGSMMADGSAAAAAGAYNAALVKQGINTGFVSGAQLARNQILFNEADHLKQAYLRNVAHTEALLMNQRALDATSLSTRALTTAKVALSSALNLVGGPLGAITLALMVGYWWWEKYGNAAEKAKKQAGIEVADAKKLADSIEATNEATRKKLELEWRLREEKSTGNASPVSTDDKAIVAMGNDYAVYLREVKRGGELLAQSRGFQDQLNHAVGAGLTTAVGMTGDAYDSLKKKIDSTNTAAKESLSSAERIKKGALNRSLMEPGAPGSAKMPPLDDTATGLSDVDKAFNHLVDGWDRWNAKVIQSEKYQNALQASIGEVNRELEAQLRDGAGATGADAEMMRARYKRQAEEVIKNKTEADTKRGQGIFDKEKGSSELTIFKAQMAEKKAQLQIAHEDQKITTASMYDSLLSYSKQEADKEIVILEQIINKKKEAAKTEVDKFAQGKGSQGAILESSAELLAAETILAKFRADEGRRQDTLSREKVKALRKEREEVIALQTATATMQNTRLTDEAKKVGTSAVTGEVINPVANEMAIIKEAHEEKLRMIELEKAAILEKQQASAANLSKWSEYEIQLSELRLKTMVAGKDKEMAINKLQKDQEKAGYDRLVTQAGQVFPKITSFAKLSAMAQADYTDKTKNQYTGMEQGKMKLAGDSAAFIGNSLMDVANMQDKTSRSGFETAKALQIGATIMSTASAVMAQLTIPGPAGWAMAAAAAALGAVQIALIASTSFGDSGSGVKAPSGSFQAGGAGSSSGSNPVDNIGTSTGSAYTSIANQQTSSQLNRIADAMGNAAHAMLSVSDSLFTIADSFKSGGAGSNLAIDAPNRFAQKNTAVNDVNYGGNMLKGAAIGAAWGAGGGIAGAIGGAIVGTVVGAIYSLGQSMFGSGSWTRENSGIQMGLKDGKISSQDFVDMKKKGGWFSSDKSRTDWSKSSDPFTNSLNSYYGNMSAGLNQRGTMLGVGSQIDNATKNSTYTSGKINTAGRSIEDITKDIENAFNDMSNRIITDAIPNIAAYAINSSETATAVYNRLSDSIANVTSQYDLIGKAMTLTGIEGANAAYKMEQLFGGTDKFNKAMDAYSTAMFTDPEKQVLKAKVSMDKVRVTWMMINNTYEDANLIMPTTNEEFRNLVNTVTNPELVATLIELGPAFAEVTKQMKAVSQSTMDYQVRILKLNPAYKNLSSVIDLQITQQTEMKDAIAAGLDITSLKIAQELEMADAMKTASSTVSEAMQKILDASKTALTDSISFTQSILNAKKTLLTGAATGASTESAYKTAKANMDTADKTNVVERVNALITASKTYNASSLTYQKDYAAGIAKLDQFSNTTGDLSAVDKQLVLLDEISKAITSGDQAMLKQLSVTWEAMQIDTGSAASALGLSIKALIDVTNTPITPSTTPDAIKLQITNLQDALKDPKLTGVAAEAVKSSIGALQLAFDNTISSASANDSIKTTYTVVQGALDGTINGTLASTYIAQNANIIQNALNGSIDSATATSAIANEKSIISANLNRIIDSSTAVSAIATERNIIQLALDNSIDAETAKYYIDGEKKIVQAAVNGSIDSATAKSAIDIEKKLIQGVIDGTISAADAKIAITKEQKTIQDVVNGTISGADGKKAIETQLGLVTTALSNGLNNPTDSVSANLIKFNEALTASAKATKDGLLNFVNALAIVSDYTSQKTIAQTTVSSLLDQYKTGTLSVADYKTKSDAAVATLNSTIAKGQTNGLTGLSGVTTAPSTSDTDSRMQVLAGTGNNPQHSYTFGTTMVSSLLSGILDKVSLMQQGFIPADLRYDLNSDGKIDFTDFMNWWGISQGSYKYSSFKGKDGLPLPAFATGTASVPYDMTAQIHQGEIIMDRASSDVLRKYGIPTTGSADNKESLAEQKETNRQLAANVRVLQAGFNRLIEINEKQESRLATMEQKARQVANQ